MAGKTNTKRPSPKWNGNFLEAFKDLAGSVGESFTDDLIKGGAKDIADDFGELLGVKSIHASGTLSSGEQLDVTALEANFRAEKKSKENPQGAPEKQAVRRTPENFVFLQKEKDLENEVEALLAEIKREVKRFEEATENLEVEVAKITVEETPPNPGIYHVNFFEWLLGILKTLKVKVESANLWLSAVQSRKAKKGYWSSFKKHGTSFGMSSERVVSTQTG
ncbi:hypothetical protein HY439_01060 [Candidatus Microgenomates bacterium]|nr:hypothetical protein [Candidatus Microgenomates bacterium]